MKSRREFFQLVGKTAIASTILSSDLTEAQRSHPHHLASTEDMLLLQQKFVDLRFGMFLHFNMATFQDREWGDPTSPQELFAPTSLDTDQWAAAAKSAKMTWGCLTTRHHDGFCIWPTRTRGNSIAQTTHKQDVVRAYVDSFRQAGLRVGLYYSILSLRDDIRHFNVTPGKMQLIKDQLTELFSNYGEIDILITDGWDAPWSRITYEEIPFREIYDHIKALQPQCLICDLNAASYPTGGLFYSDIKAFEQNAGQKVPLSSDLPSLSCVTITDGWFWKQADMDGSLKEAGTVVNDWLIPLNRRHCNLILNAPPTREGRLAPNVVERLAQIGRMWNPETLPSRLSSHPIITTPNLARSKPIRASSSPDTVGPDLANDGSFASSWHPDAGDRKPWLEVDLEQDHRISVVTLIQHASSTNEVALQQFEFEGWNGSNWIPMTEKQGPAPTEVIRIAPANVRRVRIKLTLGSGTPFIADVGLYDEP